MGLTMYMLNRRQENWNIRIRRKRELLGGVGQFSW